VATTEKVAVDASRLVCHVGWVIMTGWANTGTHSASSAARANRAKDA